VALVAALAGCGGGSDKDEPGRTVSVQAGAPIPVSADEYKFDPKTIVVNGAKREAKVAIALKNDGSLAHDLHVLKGEEDLGGTPVFTGGKTENVSLSLAPGDYTFICTVGDHETLGMKGKLTVK
jgi:plastocyanin